jgi:hypothetical protein
MRRAVGAHNNPLDQSGGCSFVKWRGHFNLALIRAARSTPRYVASLILVSARGIVFDESDD